MIRNTANSLFSVDFWRFVGRYVGVGKSTDNARLETPAALGAFLHSRASHVAQTSLYGYMKTRAGTGFPALFEDPAILASINIAKWQVWLACLSDLAVYGGVLLCRRGDAPPARVRAVLAGVVADVLAHAGTPAEAGADFAAAARKVGERIAGADFEALGDDDSAFTESPAALVYWAPIDDELKNRDVEIVRNSVRFRWREVRRDLRRLLRAEALLRRAGE